MEGKGTLPPRGSLRTRRPFSKRPATSPLPELKAHVTAQSPGSCQLTAWGVGGAETPVSLHRGGLMADQGWPNNEGEIENGNWRGDQVIGRDPHACWETVSRSGLYDSLITQSGP